MTTVKLPVKTLHGPNRDLLLSDAPVRRVLDEKTSFACDACGQALAATIRDADDEPRGA